MKSQRVNTSQKRKRDTDADVKKTATRQTQAEKPRKRRRKRKDDGDRAYNPRGKSRRGGGNKNAFHLRIKVTNKKLIAAYYLDDEVKGINQAVAKKHIREAITVIRNGKPLDLRVLERSEKGTPKVVKSPGKTKYYLTQNHRSILFFTDAAPKPEQPPVTSLERDNPLFASEPFQYVVENDADEKSQKVFLSHQHLQAVAKRRGKRSETQNRVMAKEKKHANKAGATGYAQATDKFPADQKFEYLHGLAYGLLGEILKIISEAGIVTTIKAQHPGNLGIGSYDANTHEIPVERTVADYAKALDGVEYEVTMHMIKGTQICHTIDVIISRDELRVPYRFNALTNVPPHRDQEKYVEAMKDGIIKGVLEKEPEVSTSGEKYNFETPKRGETAFLRKNPPARRNLSDKLEAEKLPSTSAETLHTPKHKRPTQGFYFRDENTRARRDLSDELKEAKQKDKKLLRR